jgi:hypothetical protein
MWDQMRTAIRATGIFISGPGASGIFAAQPSPADPDGEGEDQGQRQPRSELDEEQKVGHRRDAKVTPKHAWSAGVVRLAHLARSANGTPTTKSEHRRAGGAILALYPTEGLFHRRRRWPFAAEGGL